MNNPIAKPSQHLHPETRCFLEWLETRGLGKAGEPTELQERLRDLRSQAEGRDYQVIWDTLLGSLFQEWVDAVRQEISGDDLPTLVQAILGQEEDPPAAKEALRKRIEDLRAKIAQVADEDEEFQGDLAEIERSLASYTQVIEQFGDDQRLDEVLRRGVKQAVMVKERDFAWFEALLERLRSEKQAEPDG